MYVENKGEINRAISEFEKFNNINIDNYISDEVEDDMGKITDNYIGQDIFIKTFKNGWSFLKKKIDIFY